MPDNTAAGGMGVEALGNQAAVPAPMLARIKIDHCLNPSYKTRPALHSESAQHKLRA